MISICIPIYNFNVTKLVETLIHQGKELQHPFEIICIDDHSSDYFKKINAYVETNENIQFFSLKKNIGRSKIRNMFIDISKFDKMLFIDCDCSISSDLFLKNYMDISNCDVIYGGRKHHQIKPKKSSERLRWRYGVKVEDQSFDFRLINPYHSFRSNNFLIKKSVFKAIKFDESFNGYGHEDTLLALELQKNNIKIHQIDNPVYHEGLEKNTDFLLKTRSAIRNLSKIESKNYNISSLKLINTYLKIKKLNLDKFLLLISKNGMIIIEKQLMSSWPSLRLFNLYKLLFYIRDQNNV